MAKPTTPYQRGIIKRYYDNKEHLMVQKLSETVSELYMCEDPGKTDRLWKSAHTALKNLKVPEKKVERCVSERDTGLLAKIVSDLF